MATLTDLQAAVAAVKANNDKIGTDVTAVLAALKTLQGQPGGINPADLDPIVATLQGIAAASGATDAALEAAVPPAPVTSA